MLRRGRESRREIPGEAGLAIRKPSEDIPCQAPFPLNSGSEKLFKKGLKHLQEGRIELAEACYRKILKVDPTSTEARQLWRALGTGTGSVERPAPLPGATLADDPFALGRRAQSYLEEGALGPAMECLRRVVELEPNSPEAHQQIGQLQEQMGVPRGRGEFLSAGPGSKPAIV